MPGAAASSSPTVSSRSIRPPIASAASLARPFAHADPPSAVQALAQRHPDARHDDAWNGAAVRPHDMNERALAGAEQGGARVGVLLELGATGAPHQLPMLIGADRNLAAVVDHVTAVGALRSAPLGGAAVETDERGALVEGEAQAQQECCVAVAAHIVERDER